MPEDETPETRFQPDIELVEYKPSALDMAGLQVEPADLVLFLAHMAVTGNVSDSCRQARISRPTVYRIRREVPSFKDAWNSAMKMARDNLEREAWRRAVDGVERKVFQGGKTVGVVREYSDALLTTMLRARHPAYAKTAAGAVNVQVDNSQKTLVVGPTVPADADLGNWIGRLSEVAQQHGVLPSTTEDEDDGTA